MVKHIVMFRLKEELGEAERSRAFEDFKQGIEALPAHISCIRHIEVRRNVNPEEQWDICLVSEFATLDEVRTYSQHPLHVEVAGRLKPNVAARACVDYEY